HALVVPLPRGLAGAILIRIENARTLPQGVAILERDLYQREDLGFVRRFGAVYTVLAVIALIGFTFWLRLRDPVYLWFVAYVLGHLVYFMSSNGDIYDVPLLGRYFLEVPGGVAVGANVAVVAGIHFAQRFGRLPSHTPWLSRVLWVGAAFGWALTFIAARPRPLGSGVLAAAGHHVVLGGSPL